MKIKNVLVMKIKNQNEILEYIQHSLWRLTSSVEFYMECNFNCYLWNTIINYDRYIITHPKIIILIGKVYNSVNFESHDYYYIHQSLYGFIQ